MEFKKLTKGNRKSDENKNLSKAKVKKVVINKDAPKEKKMEYNSV